MWIVNGKDNQQKGEIFFSLINSNKTIFFLWINTKLPEP